MPEDERKSTEMQTLKGCYIFFFFNLPILNGYISMGRLCYPVFAHPWSFLAFFSCLGILEGNSTLKKKKKSPLICIESKEFVAICSFTSGDFTLVMKFQWLISCYLEEICAAPVAC